MKTIQTTEKWIKEKQVEINTIQQKAIRGGGPLLDEVAAAHRATVRAVGAWLYHAGIY